MFQLPSESHFPVQRGQLNALRLLLKSKIDVNAEAVVSLEHRSQLVRIPFVTCFVYLCVGYPIGCTVFWRQNRVGRTRKSKQHFKLLPTRRLEAQTFRGTRSQSREVLFVAVRVVDESQSLLVA